MKRRKIVIVDDSEVVRDLVRLSLEPQGFDVVTLASAFGFTNALFKEMPDLALVDVTMPGLSGDKLAEIAMTRGAPCPIVLFSDRPEAELDKFATGAGVAGYIRKTGDMRALAKMIDRFIKK
jgi:DNA-binding response OmpR family regulator